MIFREFRVVEVKLRDVLVDALDDCVVTVCTACLTKKMLSIYV